MSTGFSKVRCSLTHIATDRQVLIPREVLFAPSSCLAIRLSPDGEQLAYVGQNPDGAMNLYLSSNLSLDGAQNCTYFTEPEIRGFYWSPDSQKILFLKDKDGTRQHHLFCLDSQTLEFQNLTAGYSQISCKIFKMGINENKAIIGINDRNPRFHDLYSLDIDSGTLTLLYQNDNYINFVFDENLNLILKLRMNDDCSMTLLDQHDLDVLTWSAEDAFHSECLRYSSLDNSLYLLDNRGKDTTQLKKVFLDGKTPEIVLGHDLKSDIHEVFFEGDQVSAYSTYFLCKGWHFLNEQMKRSITFLISKLGSNFTITDRTSEQWIVQNNIPDQGGEFWLYHLSTQKLSLLVSSEKRESSAKMYPLLISASDGLSLVSYLTLPPKVDLGGRASSPVPLVIIPHGGPFKVRDLHQYCPYHQWLANRGYAVLSVNFRLSSGFGKNFVNAGNREWGGKAHQDILDAAQWCIDQGIAAKDKIAIFGASYGGYEALTSLVFSPEFLACAISLCGPSHLKTVLDNVPFYWEIPDGPLADKMRFFTKNAFIKSMGGDPDKEADIPFLESCSPLNYVDNIQKPLLLIHGANDPIVAVAESDQIFEKMKQKGLPVTYLSFPDEGHGIAKFNNLMCSLAQSEKFLAQFLGGEYEILDPHQLSQSSGSLQS